MNENRPIRPRETRHLNPDLTGRSGTRRTNDQPHRIPTRGYSPAPIPQRSRHEFPTQRTEINLARSLSRAEITNDARTWEPLGITARRRRRRRRVRGTSSPRPPALMGWGRNGVGGSTPPRARCGGRRTAMRRRWRWGTRIWRGGLLRGFFCLPPSRPRPLP